MKDKIFITNVTESLNCKDFLTMCKIKCLPCKCHSVHFIVFLCCRWLYCLLWKWKSKIMIVKFASLDNLKWKIWVCIFLKQDNFFSLELLRLYSLYSMKFWWKFYFVFLLRKYHMSITLKRTVLYVVIIASNIKISCSFVTAASTVEASQQQNSP
jgi:hypothetical protein